MLECTQLQYSSIRIWGIIGSLEHAALKLRVPKGAVRAERTHQASRPEAIRENMFGTFSEHVPGVGVRNVPCTWAA